MVIFAVFAGAFGLAQKSGQLWLDAPPKNWNRAGATIPHAPKMEFPRECTQMIRAARSPEEKAVEREGWKIPSGDAPERSDVIIIMAMASGDGMCRPEAYQMFIFVNGVFAGTASPGEMSSRTDGAVVGVYRSGARGLTAEFNRYTDADPLCCPSRLSRATYEIIQQGKNPLVLLTAVETQPTQ